MIQLFSFTSENEAREFGRKLKAALEVSAVAARVGVDAGQDLATSALAKSVKKKIKNETGAHMRDNVHGLDVFPDLPNTHIFSATGTGSALVSPEPFLTDLDALHQSDPAPSQRIADVILLLNYALMRPEPVAQIVFAVSAVEALGQDETWTDNQTILLKELAAAAVNSSTGTDAERQEVADAIRKGLHRLSLRQGVFRLLDRLNLAHLKKPWDDLYSERTTLVHGLAPKPGADYTNLGRRTVGLCGQILLKAVAAEIPLADRHVASHYVG